MFLNQHKTARAPQNNNNRIPMITHAPVKWVNTQDTTKVYSYTLFVAVVVIFVDVEWVARLATAPGLLAAARAPTSVTGDIARILEASTILNCSGAQVGVACLQARVTRRLGLGGADQPKDQYQGNNGNSGAS